MRRKVLRYAIGIWAIAIYKVFEHGRILLHSGALSIARVIGADYYWPLVVFFAFVAFLLTAGISFSLFRGAPKDWSWERMPGVFGMSAQSAVLVTGSMICTTESTRMLGFLQLAAAIISFTAVVGVAAGQKPKGMQSTNYTAGSRWRMLRSAFQAGREQVR